MKRTSYHKKPVMLHIVISILQIAQLSPSRHLLSGKGESVSDKTQGHDSSLLTTFEVHRDAADILCLSDGYLHHDRFNACSEWTRHGL